MSLGSKLSFLASKEWIDYNVSDDHVTITTTNRNFIWSMASSDWKRISAADIESLTLVGFSILANDDTSYGSRQAIDWFNHMYPGKFFIKDPIMLHQEYMVDNVVTIEPKVVRCNEHCNHGLRLEDDGEIRISH